MRMYYAQRNTRKQFNRITIYGIFVLFLHFSHHSILDSISSSVSSAITSIEIIAIFALSLHRMDSVAYHTDAIKEFEEKKTACRLIVVVGVSNIADCLMFYNRLQFVTVECEKKKNESERN